jgi:hypothetical protein
VRWRHQIHLIHLRSRRSASGNWLHAGDKAPHRQDFLLASDLRVLSMHIPVVLFTVRYPAVRPLKPSRREGQSKGNPRNEQIIEQIFTIKASRTNFSAPLLPFISTLSSWHWDRQGILGLTMHANSLKPSQLRRSCWGYRRGHLARVEIE